MSRSDWRSAIQDALSDAGPEGRTLREIVLHYSGGRLPTASSESALARQLELAREFGSVVTVSGVGVNRRYRLTGQGAPLV